MDTETVRAGLTIADLPDTSWPRHELIDGSLLVTPAGSLHHQGVITDLAAILRQLAPRDLKVLTGPNIIEPPTTLLIPDVAVVTRQSYDQGGLGLAPGDARWVIEVLSPSTHRVDRVWKRETYLGWGVATYWLIDPDANRIERFGSDPHPAWASALDEDELFDS